MATRKYGKHEGYAPDRNIPDDVQVPSNTIAVLTEHPRWNEEIEKQLLPLTTRPKRSWFNQHFGHCLPLMMGNQLGWVLRSQFDFQVTWYGHESKGAMIVEGLPPPKEQGKNSSQIIESHFGHGILTIKTRFTFRTPKGVNLLVGQPPNTITYGYFHMVAMVETDNLRRDFTFNLKFTDPGRTVRFQKNSPLGWIMPFPRHFVDAFNLRQFPEGPILEQERDCMVDFGRIRDSLKKGTGGNQDHLYMHGKDCYQNPFPDHQTKLKRCPIHDSPSTSHETTPESFCPVQPLDSGPGTKTTPEPPTTPDTVCPSKWGPRPGMRFFPRHGSK